MDKSDIIKPENLVYKKPKLMNDNPMHYCPGCSHGVVHKLIAEVIEEMGMEHKSVGVSPVGCAVFIYNYLDIDWEEAAHGRAPAVATAIKRLWPDRLVFSYQGDGDLAAIGTAETIHALNRGENITIIFINNAIYGMTGGQMAPTTLVGMKTATCPYGRDPKIQGYPLKITEGKEGHPKSIRKLHAGQRLEPRRDSLHVQLGLEDVAGESQQMDGGQYVPVLSTRRLERQRVTTTI